MMCRLEFYGQQILEAAQESRGHNFDIRKHLLDYDDGSTNTVIYRKRDRV